MRGLVLRKSSKFQRDAQRKMVESRRKRSRKPQTEASMNDALAKADENELQLFKLRRIDVGTAAMLKER